MLSARLIQMIEDRWEMLARRTLLVLRMDQRLVHYRELPESELLDRVGEVFKNLGKWLSVGDEEELARRYQALGRQRFEESIPLAEVVHVAHLIKKKIIDFVRDQGITQTAVDVYAQEELEHRVDLFFDEAIYHLVRGYEESAWQGLSSPVKTAQAV